MRNLVLAMLVTALAGVLATTALAAGRTVRVGDYFFVRDGADRPRVTVAKGTRVTFKWVGRASHNVHAISGPTTFKSKVRGGSSYRFRRTFRQRGTYRLVCDVHPSFMRMTLRVK